MMVPRVMMNAIRWRNSSDNLGRRSLTFCSVQEQKLVDGDGAFAEGGSTDV